MPTDEEADDPTIEVRVITVLDVLDFMADLGPSSGVTVGSFGGSHGTPRRNGLGLTLEGLAERAAQEPNYLGTIERGRRDPSLSEVMMKMGCELAPDSRGSLTNSAMEAAAVFAASSREVQEAALRILRNVSRGRKPPAPDDAGN